MLIRDRLALRVAAVRDHGDTWRYNEYDEQDRLYLAAQLRAGPRTVVDAQFEYGEVEKSNGTPAGATDGDTIWAAAGKRLSATADAAAGVVSYGAADYLAVDTDAGTAWNMRNRMRSRPQPAVPGVGGVPYLTDFTLLPKRTSLGAGRPFPQEAKYARSTLFVAHAFSRDLKPSLPPTSRAPRAPR